MTEQQFLNFCEELEKTQGCNACKLPDRDSIRQFAHDLLGILFPHFNSRKLISAGEIGCELKSLKSHFKKLLMSCEELSLDDASVIAESVFKALPAVYDLLCKDADAICAGDPAADSVTEVIVAYPGFYATAIFRIAHELYLNNARVFARILTEFAHSQTGIDINPGATIGEHFCIDHGTGIVIGETTQIGNDVKLYQGVTLGALSVKKELAKNKRHPTIESDVVVYANAAILGGDTVIGKGSTIGGNVWITESIPENSTVYRKMEQTVKQKNDKK